MRNPIQNIYIKKVEKKKMHGYDKDELWNSGDPDLPEREPVLDLQEGGVPQAAGVQPRLPALQVLQLRGLSKSFGGLAAVRDVSLEISPGERKAMIGPNGAGKTTLFNLITGVFPSSSGEIVLFGKDVTRWPPHQRTALGMARTFQITSLFPKLTVLDNVLLALAGVGWTKLVMWRPLASYRDTGSRATQLLETAGYWERRDTEVRNLSHGEQRQIEVVLGLASDPKLLLLDEPAAGLSSGESREMAEFLKRLDPGLAILLIEHDMDVVFDVVTEHLGAAFRRAWWKRDPAHRYRTASACSRSTWAPDDPARSRTSTRTTATPMSCRGCRSRSAKGQIVGLLGRNGVGKTTLVNSIVGFNRPRRGRIVFKGNDITGLSSFETVRRGMGLVPQGRRVFASLTVEENLKVASDATARGRSSASTSYSRASSERRQQRAKTLSGGEQQMLAIARGLMTDPDCLIMDEPSEGLAPIIIQGVWQAVASLRQEGLSILLVEQNAALALQLVDHVHVMSKGRVVYSGAPKALWADEDVKSRYLGSGRIRGQSPTSALKR